MSSTARWLLVVAGVAIVALGAVGFVVGRSMIGSSDPADNQQEPAAPLSADDDPDRGDFAVVTETGVAAGPAVEIAVTIPDGATEMQIGADPTFDGVVWQPVADRVEVVVDDAGYQMLFGRFRAATDGSPSPTTVVGVTIDPTYDAAVASATGLHRPSWARPLSATTLVVRIEAGRLERGGQETYDFAAPPATDEIDTAGDQPVVVRDGERHGRRLDGHDDVLRVFDRLVGTELDIESVASGEWTVSSGDDPAYGSAQPVTVLDRVSRPNGGGTGPGGALTPMVHDVVVELGSPLVAGSTYTITPPADLVEAIELSLDPASTISPAVHVNQNGYDTADALKVAYLSAYLGNLGGESYAAGIGYSVIDTSTGSVVHEGQTAARPGGDELGMGDLTGVPVFEIDFSPVTTAGRYQVCVDGVGCSTPFDVAGGVWGDLVVDVARAMYHQRSGVPLGPPYTAIGRPRPYHPDDGLVVRESSFRLIDSISDPEGRFAGLVEGAGDETMPEAWGGHFDAGDWDRRIEHLYYLRAVVELVERYPELYASMDLMIPESGDAVPDLIDEGLWSLDLFRRLQRDDGAITGGVEAAEHPLTDTTSWTDPLAVFTFEPDPWASYVYVGVAAQTAAVLREYDPERAESVLDSALAAMRWAEGQPAEGQPADEEVVRTLREHRSVAAIALYKATGDEAWHDLFLEASDLDAEVDPFLSCHEHGRCDAGWIYLGIDPELTDAAVRDLITESFVATADDIVDVSDETAFGWTVENRYVPLIWGLGVGGAPNAIALTRAYELTGDVAYREAAERAAAVSLGANTTNTSFVTGVGAEPVRHPLIVDVQNGALDVWPGTPVYGHHLLERNPGEEWVEEFLLGPTGMDPLPTEQPYLWQWVDSPAIPMFNEFTVFQSHGQAIHTFGLLAGAASSGR